MKRDRFNLALIFLIFILIAGYGLAYTLGSRREINAAVNTLLPADRQDVIDTTLLENVSLKAIEALQTYGTLPVPRSGTVVRPNPFEGI